MTDLTQDQVSSSTPPPKKKRPPVVRRPLIDPDEQKKINKDQGLKYIDKFGWIHASTLGQLLWPLKATNHQMALKLLHRWEKEGWVLPRKLPLGAGNVYVLAKAGERQLSSAKIEFIGGGKDVGRPDEKTGAWIPPKNWEHDLLAQRLLAWIYAWFSARGKDEIQEFFSERELHRMINRKTYGLKKVPDGLVVGGTGEIIWVEVERSRKELGSLVEAAIRVLTNKFPQQLGQYEPNRFLFCVPVDAIDPADGSKINHKERIERMLASRTKAAVKPYFLQFKQRRTSKMDCAFVPSTDIQPDPVAGRVKSLERQIAKCTPVAEEGGATTWQLDRVEYFSHVSNRTDDHFVDVKITQKSVRNFEYLAEATQLEGRAPYQKPQPLGELKTLATFDSMAALKRDLSKLLYDWHMTLRKEEFRVDPRHNNNPDEMDYPYK